MDDTYVHHSYTLQVVLGLVLFGVVLITGCFSYYQVQSYIATYVLVVGHRPETLSSQKNSTVDSL